MTIYDRYVLRQILFPTAIAAVALLFLIVANATRQELAILLDDRPNVVIQILDILRLGILAVPMLLSFVIPAAFLLGAMLTLNGLARDSEVVAWRAAGVSMRRIAAPILVLGALLTLALLAVTGFAQPWAYSRVMQLVAVELPLRASMDTLPLGVMTDIGGWQIYARDRKPGHQLVDVVVVQPHANGRASAFYADTADLTGPPGEMLLRMRNGYLIPGEGNAASSRVAFDELSKTIPSVAPRDRSEARKAMPIWALVDEAGANLAAFQAAPARRTAQVAVADLVELNNRLALPIMCLALAGLAVPLATSGPRSGRSYTFTAGLLVFLAYFVIRNYVEVRSPMPIGLAVALGQTPNLVLAAFGAALLWRMDRA